MTRRLLSPWSSLPLIALLAVPAFAAETGKKTPGPAPAPTTDQVRRAVERSLPFLEKEGLAWMKERKCIACHHGPFLLWSHNEASQHSFAVDAKKLDAWTDQALGLFLANLKSYQEKKNGCVESTNLLLAQVALKKDDKRSESFKKIAAILVNAQQADGSWKYEGQGQKRPAPEANEATTLWAILALPGAKQSNPIPAKNRERALAWMKAIPANAGSNEAAALRMVIEKEFGDAGKAKELAKSLAARQNADGGWSWSKGFPSDSYATGQSLYALGRVGIKGDDPVVKKAWAFLLQGQKPDGSWYAPTKKPTNKDNPIAAYWGSAWATIGLIRTLPEKGP